jgi:hypothetical protein
MSDGWYVGLAPIAYDLRSPSVSEISEKKAQCIEARASGSSPLRSGRPDLQQQGAASGEVWTRRNNKLHKVPVLSKLLHQETGSKQFYEGSDISAGPLH